jgi:hypothetical protein
MKKYIKSPALVAFEREQMMKALAFRLLILAASVAVLAAVIAHQFNN